MLEKLAQIGLVRKFLDWSASESGKTALIGFIIVLVGFSGFGLGRLSALEGEKTSLTIRDTELQEAASAASSQGDAPVKGGGVVASKNGSKYHFPWCAGAKTIGEANKIWFDSPESARKAGYTPASNCKGLK